MIAARFRLVGWVAGCAGAALCCYMVSQSVAAQRSGLAKIDHDIAQTKLDIGRLETEITARSRAGQLELWNVSTFRLQAARPAQYMGSGIQLANLAGAPRSLDRPNLVPVAYHPEPAAAAPAPVVAVAQTVAPAVPMAAKPILAAHVEPARPAVREQSLLHTASFVQEKPTRLGAAPATPLVHTAFEKPAPVKLVSTKPAKVEEPKRAEAKRDTKPLLLADAKPAKAKPHHGLDDALLPDDLGKLVAAERKAKPVKKAL